MKQISKIIALALGLSQAPVFAGPTTVVLLMGNTFESVVGDFSGLVYLANTVKINDRYSLIPELRTDFNLTTGGKSAVSASHTYARIYLRDNSLARVGAWKVGMMYRYALPTTMALQEAGSFGTLSVRPDISRSFLDRKLNILGRLTLSAGLLRNRYQVLSTGEAGDKRTGNAIYSHVLEFLPSYQISESFSANLNWTVDGALVLAAQGATEGSFKHRFYHSYGVAYSSPAIWDTSIEVGFSHGPSAFGKGFTLMSKKGGAYYIELARVF